MSDDKTDSRPEETDAAAHGTRVQGREPKSGPGETGGGAPAKAGWSTGDEASRLETLEAEAANLKDKLLRTVAEMENLRRRTEREKADTAKYAISNFARDVLSVGDNIRRAIEAVPDDAAQSEPALKSLLDGVEMTERELLNALERHGITRFDPKGERFDPNQHQAMFEIENKAVPAGTVVEVMQPGYTIADRILRPALVGVSRGGEKLPKKAAPEPEAKPDMPPAANDDTPEAGDGDKAARPEPGEGTEPAASQGDATVGANIDKSA